MESAVKALLSNHILVSAVLAWAAAQIIKTVLVYRKTKELDLERLFGSGGMPSSHTAFVVAMATAAAMVEGLASSTFALSFILASIVMYDAAGVRQAAGQQARVLNRLIKQLRSEHILPERELKELLGHTPLEVLAGAVLGFLIAYNLA
ncbi:MAG: divergent PAP2 family protein [Selenomonadales bacterium]|nr:divergent PAP2 family protein [Selenomonadales bacterium]MBQ2245707.1 divergent PAP2 family protein [Selenomonadales bacterium]MBQ5636464.1 divergent PAP2 family protein [Selenomonadales bacterium]MBR0325480.1 divergent PAP2 family protein [Selenomonadales bacterium]